MDGEGTAVGRMVASIALPKNLQEVAVPRPSRAIRESGMSESAPVCLLVLLIGWLVAAAACGPAPAPDERDRPPSTATLAVETFTVTDSAPKKWDADLFADSV